MCEDSGGGGGTFLILTTHPSLRQKKKQKLHPYESVSLEKVQIKNSNKILIFSSA